MSHNNIFYVYCYNDITTGVPCYIGKGHTKKGYNRSKVKHTHNTNVHAMEKEQGITIIMLKEHLSEVDAFLWEMHYIKEIGRLDLGTGPLLNQTDGGDGAAGHRQTPEAKEKQSKAMMGEKNPFFGKTHTLEAKKKMGHPGEKHPFFGKTHTPEAKEKQSKAVAGEKNPNYGKTHTSDAKKKMGIAQKESWRLKKLAQANALTKEFFF